jgi:uncharacterized BrkB/YihY/UPF0761 family membrane protein
MDLSKNKWNIFYWIMILSVVGVTIAYSSMNYIESQALDENCDGSVIDVKNLSIAILVFALLFSVSLLVTGFMVINFN